MCQTQAGKDQEKVLATIAYRKKLAAVRAARETKIARRENAHNN